MTAMASVRPGQGGVYPLQHLAQGIGVLHLSVETPERVPGWDWVILTAASSAQANIYREQLEAVRRRGLLPEQTQTLVVQDPDGRRIGSGGATLNALRALAAETQADAPRQRVLLVHAGGDSKRVPWAGIFGKCFIPFPVLADADRPVPTLFDHILAISAPVAARMSAGGLLCFAGDALPLFASSRLALPADGTVVVTAPVSLDVAARHGVIVADEAARVTDLLQKPDVAELTERSALVRGCAALLDTGIYAFCGDAYGALSRLACEDADPVRALLDRGEECSLYEEVAAALVPSRHDWLPSRPLGDRLLPALRDYPLMHHEAEDLTFVHMGSTAEVLDHLRALWGGQLARRILADCGQNVDTGSTVYASTVVPNATVSPGSLLYGSRLGPEVHVGTRCVVLNVDAENTALCLPDNTCLWQVPIRTADDTAGLLTVCCGVDDNPKRSGGEATFANRSLDTWLSAHRLTPRDIWEPDGPPTLWNARLFPLHAGNPLQLVTWMLTDAPSPEHDNAWRSARRMSFADLHDVVSAVGVSRRQQNLVGQLALQAVTRAVRGGLARNIAALGTQAEQGGSAAERMVELATSGTVSACATGQQQSRRLQMQADLTALRGDADTARQRTADAFSAVQEEVATAVSGGTLSGVADIPVGRRECTELPVRFDIAGGWSDTPPYCLERPAAVLNLAATLGGVSPVGADVEALEAPCWDLGLGRHGEETLTVHDGEDVAAAAGLRDRFALLRHALVLSGFGAERHISQGVCVRTWAHVPRGSGLGTSSILGAALLTALQRLAGRPADVETVSGLVLMLEQRMTTGGGWQDQIGGLVPGIKLVSSVPIRPVRLSVERVPLLPSVVEELEARLVIAFTGIERLAKNVLQIVVARYLQRDSRVVSAIADLVDLAHAGRKCFAMGDLDGVGAVMGEAWDVHQVLDPHCGNVAVDAVFDRIADLCTGIKLAGAGGGGFLGAMAKDAEAARRVRAILSDVGGGPGVYDWRLYAGE